MAVSLSPWMGRVVGGNANTPQSLQSLLLALGAVDQPTIGPSNVLRCSYVQIQADPLGGGAKYYIGRSDMSTTDFGVYLVASQAWQPPQLGFNLYRLDQIFLESDTAGVSWYVVFLRR